MLPQAAQNKILPFIPTAVYNYKARVFYNTLQQTTDHRQHNTTQHNTKQNKTKQNKTTYYKVYMEYNLIQLQISTF